MTVLLLAVVLGFGTWALTAFLRRYALSRGLMDLPNARSSHTQPTPRGGGVAIVVAFLLGLCFARALELGVSAELFYALGGAGLSIALLGFLDDHGHIAARWRLLGHFAAAAWVLFWLNGLPPIEVLGVRVALGWLGYVLAALYLVWLLNLYNFMDGIDGIASVEAISVCLGASLVYALLGVWVTAVLPLLLAACVAGFLFWNFPPARIFMGDAGSGFLGIVLGGLSLQAAWLEPRLLWVWLILLGVFIVDATYTLVRRLLRGEKVYEAHRSHAYQYAARRFGRHLPVTVTVTLLNLLWLTPVAIWVAMGGEGVLGLLLAYAPLLVLAVFFHAGEQESA